jgi:hypothetical protein
MPSVDLRWRKSHSVNEVHFFYGGHKCRTLQKFSPCRCSIALTMIRRLSAYQTSAGVRQARALSEMAASNQKHPLLPVLEKWMPVSSNSRILPLVEARMAMSLCRTVATLICSLQIKTARALRACRPQRRLGLHPNVANVIDPVQPCITGCLDPPIGKADSMPVVNTSYGGSNSAGIDTSSRIADVRRSG